MEKDYPGLRINAGCGKIRWPGWANIDFGQGDLRADIRRLPFEADSADAIAAIHVLEHFYLWEAEKIVADWRRILKPGGELVLELPCIDKVFSYIAQCVINGAPIAQFMTFWALYGDPKHQAPHMCHKWGWTKTQLIKLLKTVGFIEIYDEEPRYHFPMRDMRIVGVK